MPNYCDYSIHIHGQKKNVLKLAEWLSADYSYTKKGPNIFFKLNGKETETEHHIGWRVFECYYDRDQFDSIPDDIDVTLYASGYCAWSVYSCMMEGPFTYYTDNHEEMMKSRGVDYSLTLPAACRLLSVEAEIFSDEPGMCFSEHYHISPEGEILTEDEAEYIELYIEETESYEEFAKTFDDGCPVTKEEFSKAKEAGNSCVVKCAWLKDDEWPFKVI